MMDVSNDIVLRPRFKINLKGSHDKVLAKFEAQQQEQTNFVVTRVDEHVFIRFTKTEQHFWSPQLHLEINKTDDNSCTIHGLFGPNPTIWTLFMFLHFVIAILFIAFGIWAYTNISLNEPFVLPLAISIGMVVLWFLLYGFGRLGKAKGKPEMQQLYGFMQKTIELER